MLRPKLGRLWGNSNAIVRRDPGDEKYLKGWLSEIPTYQVLNFLQWKTDATIQALAERGVLEWGTDVAYKQGAAVWNEDDGKIYVATQSNPTDKPSSSSTQWTPSALQITRNEYDASVAAINAHIADVTGNPHKLTPGRLGTYSVAQIDALVATYRAMVLAHVQDTNNPHQLTAAIIGAVPVVGGTYTGTVTMQTGQLLLSADGKQLIKADSTGIYLKNDAGSIGVDASGKGFVKTGSAAASEIITLQTFADYKAAVEPGYATPSPHLFLPLIRDINIYVGGGTSSTTFEPQYDAGGRMAVPSAVGAADGMSFSDNPFTGIMDTTVAIDMAFIAGAAGASIYEFGIGNGGSGACRIAVQSSGIVLAISEAGTIASPSLGDGKTYRYVVRRNANETSFFINGVLIGKVTGTNKVIAGPYNFIVTSDKANADQKKPCTICNFRVWATYLTDNQISTL